MVFDVDRRQVLAYRVAAHGLHRDTDEVNHLAVLDLGVQHAASDVARVALAARVGEAAEHVLDRDEFVVVWSFRGAPHLLRDADLATLPGELWPWSEADAAARLGEWSRLRTTGDTALTAFARVAEAMHEVVTEPISKGELSAAVTARLPRGYGYECRSCKAHHVFGGIFQQVGVFAGVRLLPGRSATTLAPVRDRGPVPSSAAGAQRLVTAYLRVHGPATAAEAAGFLGTSTAQLRAVWPEDLVEVRFEGRSAFLPADRVDALRASPPPDVVRLLPPLDPYLQARDREVIVPEQAHRKKLWRMLGNPGAVLAGGEIVGTWRAKAARKKLTITVDPFTELDRRTRTAVADEAAVVAKVRGAADVEVSYEDQG